MKAGSVVQQKLATLAVGEGFWVETTTQDYGKVQRRYTPSPTRRVPELDGKVFTTSVWQALAMDVNKDKRILVRVERVS